MQTIKIHVHTSTSFEKLEYHETILFYKNIDEPCVYKKFNGNEVIFLVLYIDNISASKRLLMYIFYS